MVVVGLEDAACAGDSEASEVDGAGGAEVVDVGGDPAAVVEFPEVVAGLVVAADDEGEYGCESVARVVAVEGAEASVLGRHSKAVQVSVVADGLKVAAEEQGVDACVVQLLVAQHGGVDRIQLAVAAALDG